MKNLYKPIINIALITLFFSVPLKSFSQSDFSALNYWKYYSDAENSLYKQQCDIAFEHLKKRRDKVAQLKTLNGWKERQLDVKATFQKIIGPFPDKTPLNPVITGKVKGDGFKVEKLYFESMPGFKVTAAFFLPDGKKKNLPTIIYCSGHTDLAFRSETYQNVIINLVKKGFAVFAFDPIGQGERQQYFDEEKGKSKFGSTHEHSYPGAQLFINGASAARYMIWDGIRSVDYLLTRKEVDPDRIGITGRSGGGTQSSYIAAFDERIIAAAPECYITSLEYLWKSRGPQDAEQNFFHGIMEGIDLADLLEVRAPKPALMITTTRDIFSIEGARETYQETKKAYEVFEKQGNVQMVEDDAGHESTKKNREAMYAFFQEHLDNPGSNVDLKVDILPVGELYVTETGQLSTSIGSKFLFEINNSLSEANTQHLSKERNDMDKHLASVDSKLKLITGYNPGSDPGKLVFTGRKEFENHYVEKYVIELENNLVLPFTVFSPKEISTKAVLYLDDIKDKSSEKDYEIPLKLVENGNMIIVPDLPGYGELGPGYFKGDAYINNTSYNQWFAGILTGKSMVAIHAESIQAILHHYGSGLEGKKLVGVSKGPFNSSLLHASVFGTDFDEIVMINPILSFQTIVENREYEPSFIPFSVAGGLMHYDLPDMAAAFAPKRMMIFNGMDHQGRVAEESNVDKTYDLVKNRYKSKNSEVSLNIVVDEEKRLMLQSVLEFLNK